MSVLRQDAAQEALADALAQWPQSGVPRNPAAWLTTVAKRRATVAKRRAIDAWRRADRLEDRYQVLAAGMPDEGGVDWNPVPDDVLRLMFTACHPVLSRHARVALTLRVVGGLSTEQIARLFVLPAATVQQRVVRAKKALAAPGFRSKFPNQMNGGPGSAVFTCRLPHVH